MEQLLSFANEASPMAIIALLVIVIIQLVNGRSIMGTQKKIMSNHLHELPEMKNTLDRLESKSDKVIELLTQINTKLR